MAADQSPFHPYQMRFNDVYEERPDGKVRKGHRSSVVVLRALCKIDQNLYAIKQFKDPTSDDVNEAGILRELEHPNIVKYCGCFRDTIRVTSPMRTAGCNGDNTLPEATTTIAQEETAQDQPRQPVLYIVMELCDMSLQEYLEIHTQELAPRDVWSVFRQLWEALQYLIDKKVEHGDIKTTNVLLKRKAGNGTQLSQYAIKVADFGLACRRTRGRLLYQSVEVHDLNEGNRDIRFLGVLLLKLLYHPSLNDRQIQDALKPEPQLPSHLEPGQKAILRELLNPDQSMEKIRAFINLNHPENKPTTTHSGPL